MWLVTVVLVLGAPWVGNVLPPPHNTYTEHLGYVVSHSSISTRCSLGW